MTVSHLIARFPSQRYKTENRPKITRSHSTPLTHEPLVNDPHIQQLGQRPSLIPTAHLHPQCSVFCPNVHTCTARCRFISYLTGGSHWILVNDSFISYRKVPKPTIRKRQQTVDTQRPLHAPDTRTVAQRSPHKKNGSTILIAPRTSTMLCILYQPSHSYCNLAYHIIPYRGIRLDTEK